jgi:hypothetical protein
MLRHEQQFDASEEVWQGIVIEAPLLAFGNFFFKITSQEEDQRDSDLEDLKQRTSAPYIFPTGTGDLQGPATVCSAAG